MILNGYRAFLSYSHRDKKWAEWLHRKVETYTFPKHLSPAPDPIKPIFRDREELSVSSNLSQRVQDALENSDCLVVICSQNAVQSEWVNKEIILFRSLNPTAEIFPVIVNGEPHAEKSGFAPELECFPPALRFSKDKNDPQKIILHEPLAADLRKDKDGKQLGLVKLIAGIANIRPDELIQRDLLRARKRMTAISALSAVIISTLTLLTVSTLFAHNAAQRNAVIAEQQRELAETRRDEAEGLIEFMLGDLRRELEPVGRLAILTDVADRALEYYSVTGAELSYCKSASGAARAKYLHTRIAVGQGNFATARQYSDDALNVLNEAAPNCKNVKQFIINHTHAMQWSADLDILEHSPSDGIGAAYDPKILTKYKQAKDTLFSYVGDADTADMEIEKADAEILIGKYYINTKQYKTALAHFKMAETALNLRPLTDIPSRLPQTSDHFIRQNKHADVLTWQSGALEGLSQYGEAYSVIEEARKIYLHLLNSKETQSENWSGRFDIIGTDYAASRLLYKNGDTQAAIATLEALKTDIAKLVAHDSSNKQWQDLQDKILSSFAALTSQKSPPQTP